MELRDNVPFKYAAIQAYLTHFHKINADLSLTAYVLNPNFKLEYLTTGAIKRVRAYILKMLLDMGKGSGIAASVAREFQEYMSAAKDAPANCNPTEWWKSSNLSFINVIGLRSSYWHASSANTERIFSALDQMITTDRNRLNLDTIFDLITIQIHNKNLSKEAITPTALNVSDADGEENFSESSLLCTEVLGEEDEFFNESEEFFDNPEADSAQHELIMMSQYRDFIELIDFDRRPLEDVASSKVVAVPEDNTALARDLMSEFDL